MLAIASSFLPATAGERARLIRQSFALGWQPVVLRGIYQKRILHKEWVESLVRKDGKNSAHISYFMCFLPKLASLALRMKEGDRLLFAEESADLVQTCTPDKIRELCKTTNCSL